MCGWLRICVSGQKEELHIEPLRDKQVRKVTALLKHTISFNAAFQFCTPGGEKIPPQIWNPLLHRLHIPH